MSEGSPHADQRAHPRYDVAVPVHLTIGVESYEVTTVNVSAGGMLLAMDDAPPAGENLSLIMHLGDNTKLALVATVVHIAGIGVGFRFDRIDDHATEIAQLKAFLERQPG